VIKAVVFDVGGTLIDPNKKVRQEMFEKVFRKYKFNVKDYKEFWLKVLEIAADANVGKIKNSKTFWEAVFEKNLDKKIVEELDDAYLKPKKLYDDVVTALEKLRKKEVLAVVSNANVYWFYPPFKKFKLEKFFDVVVVSAEVGVKKPNKKIFELALRKLKVKPHEAIYVGNDLIADVYGAKKAGLKTVLIVRKKEVLEEVEAFGVKPDFVVYNLYQLEGVLKDL